MEVALEELQWSVESAKEKVSLSSSTAFYNFFRFFPDVLLAPVARMLKGFLPVCCWQLVRFLFIKLSPLTFIDVVSFFEFSQGDAWLELAGDRSFISSVASMDTKPSRLDLEDMLLQIFTSQSSRILVLF